MRPETARPATWDSGPGLDDLRLAVQSGPQVTQITTEFNYAALPDDVAAEAQAARHIARKHCLRLAVARIIVAELALGGMP